MKSTLPLARRVMKPGHLLHSAFTCRSSANAGHLKLRHPFLPVAQQLISLSEKNNIRAKHRADPQWNVEWADKLTRLHIFIPDTGTHLPGMTPKNSLGLAKPPPHRCRTFPILLVQMGYGLLCGLWVAQTNKLWTMLSSTAQSIDLLMYCAAWRFWTMRQSNGCSTPAPRSSAANQWFELWRTRSNEEELNVGKLGRRGEDFPHV